MKPITTLRLSLTLALVFALSAGLCDTIFKETVPPAARDAFDALLASRQVNLGGAGAALAAAYELSLLAAMLGMALQRRWGFPLGVIVTIGTLFQAVMFGPHVYSGVAFMLSYASKVAWGAALALAFTQWRSVATPSTQAVTA